MAEMCGVSNVEDLAWTRADGGDCEETPFWYVELPDERTARAIASRALLVKAILEAWGSAPDEGGLRDAVAAYDESRKTPYLAPGTTFKVEVEDFGVRRGSKDIFYLRVIFRSLIFIIYL